MSADQFAGSLLCVASIAFIAITTVCAAFSKSALAEAQVDDAAFPPLVRYTDTAQHAAFVRGELVDFEPAEVES